MLLFIFESIGTSELILIGIVALIFLGPRKLPSIARTVGIVMADLRNTTNEFKATWEREVNFEEEAQAIRTGDLPEQPAPRIATSAAAHTEGVSVPEIREVDASAFEQAAETSPLAVTSPISETATAESNGTGQDEPLEPSLSDKRSWL